MKSAGTSFSNQGCTVKHSSCGAAKPRMGPMGVHDVTAGPAALILVASGGQPA
jgi:hypothetical protein